MRTTTQTAEKQHPAQRVPELERLEFQARVSARHARDLQTEVQWLRFVLNRLRSAVALYIHSTDHDKDFLVQVLEATSEKAADTELADG